MSSSRQFLIILFVALFVSGLFIEVAQASQHKNDNTPSFTIEIGECTWNGQKSMSRVTFTITNTRATVFFPNGDSFPLTTARPITTAPMESGAYRYTWFTEYDSSSTTWKNEKEDYFTLPECVPQASVRLTKGACSWSEAAGSSTPVTITLDHAVLTLNDIPYTNSPTTVHLSPGAYSYRWTPTGGYQGGASNQTLTIEDCAPSPVSVSADVGTCTWSSADGSKTPVILTIHGATGTLSNGSSFSSAYNTSNSPVLLSLPPGSYAYTYTAEPDFIGAGTHQFSTPSCNPTAQVSHVTGACTYQNGLSKTSVSFGIHGAAVTLSGPNGQSYQPSPGNPQLTLQPGDYDYHWTVLPHYDGVAGSGSFHLNSCIPTQVAHAIGECDWSKNPATRDVSFTVLGAMVALTGPDNVPVSFSIDQLFDDFSPGAYNYQWAPNSGYAGAGSNRFDLPTCTPGTASAIINLKGCAYDEDNQPVSEAEILIENASLLINDETYDDSTILELAPGEYAYQWQGQPGFSGSGSGVLDTTICAPKMSAAVELSVGPCKTGELSQLAEVTFSINGAKLSLYDSTDKLIGAYENDQIIPLPPGDYRYDWMSLQGFEGSDSGIFTIANCESQTLKPAKGSNENTAGSRSPDATNILFSSPEPDLPAGGQGPALLASLFPLLPGIVAPIGIITLVKRLVKRENDQ